MLRASTFLATLIIILFTATMNPRPGVAAAGAEASQPADQPIALLDGKPIHWNHLRDLLAETAGGAILEEVVLDRLLAQRMHDRGLTLGEADLERERTILLETLDDDPNAAALALDAVRQRRALGDRRFRLLLKRNAMLRTLVHDDVEVDEADARAHFDLRYGPRYQVRLLTTATIPEAERAARRVRGGEPFAEVAAQVSTDGLSADRGGLLEPISPLDPEYPVALRRILADLEINEISPVIALESGFAIVQLVRRLPVREVEFAEVRDEMLRQARLGAERLYMDALVRELLAAAQISVLDPALRDGWRRVRGR